MIKESNAEKKLKGKSVRKGRLLDTSIRYSTKKYKLEKNYIDDVGYDLRALVKSSVTFKPGDFKDISTGIFLFLEGLIEGQIRPRSGMALKHGITVLNSPGTIDTGYKGELKVILINHSKFDYTVHEGDKIAQIVFVETLELSPNSEVIRDVETTDIEESKSRGKKGFGSSGK